jgi:lipopolysaccharide/colanic/teichoic acid biosynthesis glycosyltransferase
MKKKYLLDCVNTGYISSVGLTGWAQVNGYRESNLTNEFMRKRMEHDLWFMNNWNIWLDFYIILKTLGIIFTKPKR